MCKIAANPARAVTIIYAEPGVRKQVPEFVAATPNLTDPFRPDPSIVAARTRGSSEHRGATTAYVASLPCACLATSSTSPSAQQRR